MKTLTQATKMIENAIKKGNEAMYNIAGTIGEVEALGLAKNDELYGSTAKWAEVAFDYKKTTVYTLLQISTLLVENVDSKGRLTGYSLSPDLPTLPYTAYALIMQKTESKNLEDVKEAVSAYGIESGMSVREIKSRFKDMIETSNNVSRETSEKEGMYLKPTELADYGISEDIDGNKLIITEVTDSAVSTNTYLALIPWKVLKKYIVKKAEESEEKK